MQISLKQLDTTLERSLAPVYFISGDVPLLVQETRDKIRAAAKNAGFNNLELLNAEPKFDWNQFISITQNFNLFSDKTIIDLRTSDNKFDSQGTELLVDYCANPYANTILIISTAKLTSAQQKTKWYKAITDAGVSIPIWPLNANELQQSIQQRLKNAGLQASNDSIQLLVEMTEGNLLATQQTIDKLQLLFPNQKINHEKMQQAIADNARFNVFDLTNSALLGQAKQITRIMKQLQFAGTEPPYILWALCREIRELINHHYELQAGKNLQQILMKQWASRKTILQTALRHSNLTHLTQCLQFAAQIDQIIKGQQAGHTWQALTKLALMLRMEK